MEVLKVNIDIIKSRKLKLINKQRNRFVFQNNKNFNQ